MFILKTLAVLGAAVTVVYAQTASPTPTFDACTTSCLTNSASSNGCDLTNTTCLCTNSNFQQATVECLQANCSSTDLAAVLAAQSVECNAANTTFGPSTSTSSNTQSATSGSGTSSSGSKTSATGSASSKPGSGVTVAAGWHGLAGVGVALAGLAMGAGIVL